MISQNLHLHLKTAILSYETEIEDLQSFLRIDLPDKCSVLFRTALAIINLDFRPTQDHDYNHVLI